MSENRTVQIVVKIDDEDKTFTIDLDKLSEFLGGFPSASVVNILAQLAPDEDGA